MAAPATPGPPVVDGAILETHKENIVPSRDGRSALAISQVYSVPRTQRNKELAAMHAQYRERIDAITDDDILSDDDPIDIYGQYVAWIMDNYPSGTSTESGLLAILEEATRRFSQEAVYKNNKKYIRLWMEYANLVEQSERVYAFMIANDIGALWPHVYEEWALVLERNRNLSKADMIYRLAINRRVAGLAGLKVRYKEFQSRCLSRPADDQEPAPPAAQPVPPPSGGRTILGSRVPSGQQRGPQSIIPSTPAAQSGPRSNAGKISVYVDPNTETADAQINEWPALQTRAESVKENKSSAIDGALHQRPVAPRTPKVPIFRDEVTTPATSLHPQSSAPEQVFRPRIPSGQHELTKDPLRNYGAHWKFDIDLPTFAALLGDSEGNSNHAQSPASNSSSKTIVPPAAWIAPAMPQSRPSATSVQTSQIRSAMGPKPKPSLPAPPPGKRPEIPAFDIEVVWHNDEEYNRWETRARSEGLLGKKWPLPPVETNDDDVMMPLKDDGEGSKTESRKSMGKNRRSTNVRFNSSPTTNTKAALSDVFDMFNTTVRLEDAFEEEEDLTETAIAPITNPASIPMTPTPLSASARKSSWAPLVDNEASEPSARPALRAIDTPSQTGRTALAVATPRFEVARDPEPNPKTPAVTPGPKFSVFQEKPADLPSTTPRFEVAQDSAGSIPAKTPTVKFAVFQENGEKRLPSIAKSTSTPGLSAVTLLAPKVPSAPEEQPSRRSFSPTADGSANLPSIASLPLNAPTSFVTSPRELEENAAQDEISAPHPLPLVYKDVQNDLHASSNGPHVPTASDDVFIDRAEENIVEDEEVVEETDEVEDSYGEDEFDVDDIHPRSYEMRGGVAIMTPITERTLEYETQARASIARSARGSVASSRGGDDRILDGLDASPYTGRLSSGRPSLTTRRRSSIRPRPSLIQEHEEENEGEMIALGEPINPFTPGYVQSMLEIIWDDLDRSMYRDLTDVKSSLLDDCEAFAKKLAKSRLSKSREAPNIPMIFELGDAEYALIDKIGEGGFGAVFLAEDLAVKELAEENPEDYLPGYELVAIKTVRPSMLWEFAVLHIVRSSLPPAILSSVIAPRDFYHFSNESHLVMDYSSQGTLLDAVNHASQMGVNSQDNTGMDELLIMFFAIELIKIVICLHGQHFIHGDLKIDNCLLRVADPAEVPLETTYDHAGEGGWSERGIKLIDFGRTIDVGLFEPGQTFIGDWEADARDCVEIREGRPWTYQTDYAGLAGIIYCLMFGKYIETIVGSTDADGVRRFKVATPLKRYWQTDIWNRLYDVLLNPTLARYDGTLPLVDELSAIEEEMADWLTSNCEKKGKSLKKMLNQMHQYTKTRRPAPRK